MQRERDIRFGKWNIRGFGRATSLKTVTSELAKVRSIGLYSSP
jgi:hypothetical protein